MNQSNESYHYIVFCDGACQGNPGPGGWGAIVVETDQKNKAFVAELGGSRSGTTNNQMELEACIRALKYIETKKNSVLKIELWTDSTYVIRGITQWIWGWKKNGFVTAEGKEVSNKDQWIELFALAGKKSKCLNWNYVKGHSGVPGNERVDQIATSFADKKWVELYNGPLLKYAIPVMDLPPSGELPAPRDFLKVQQKAYSYLSLVGSTWQRHTDWNSCKARVNGVSGAKFKKAMSPEEEIQILKSWGISQK